MPKNLGEFLELAPALVALRRAHANDLRDRSFTEAAMVELLTRRWDAGLTGWLTHAEAAELAGEFTADANYRQLEAHAGVRGDYLVFSGSQRGEQLLHLESVSPVRARREWPFYLQICAPVRPPRWSMAALIRRLIRRLTGGAP